MKGDECVDLKVNECVDLSVYSRRVVCLHKGGMGYGGVRQPSSGKPALND